MQYLQPYFMLKHFLARFRLGVLLGFNYECNEVYDLILSDCLKSGVSHVSKCDEHFVIVIFNNGVLYRFWNKNKYYAWLSNKTVFSVMGKPFEFNSCRPSAYTMWKFKRIIAPLLKIQYKKLAAIQRNEYRNIKNARADV